ncbi:MAG: 16S rRNA (guanine(966)-N(2))-methyltransferase RsmD [Planctomycetota bacterium]|nr:16S rRNA (guanine(966)-N(2))-methyltransferase RsmD [Planctomycetota bacterium]
MLKILGGEFRSRTLQIPEGTQTRPMGSRTKEAIFNILRGWFEGANVLDIFAGVGTMGLEAASRGAAKVVCVEQNRLVGEFLRANIHTLGCADRVQWVQTDALGPGSIAAAPQPVNIVFIDPPFEMMADEESRQRIMTHIVNLKPTLAAKAFVVLRVPNYSEELKYEIPGFEGPEVHDYGHQQHVLLYMPHRDTAGN